MTTPESLWTAARNRAGEFRDRRTPSDGMTALLLYLHNRRPVYGHEIARATGENQGNTCRWLAKLDRFGFVEVDAVVPGVGGGARIRGSGGARPAVFWKLTRAGRELVEALVAERDGVAA